MSSAISGDLKSMNNIKNLDAGASKTTRTKNISFQTEIEDADLYLKPSMTITIAKQAALRKCITRALN